MLVLVPTPINDELPMDSYSKELLLTALSDPKTVILVEELKCIRTKWIKWGLPRSSIDSFFQLNEHTESSSIGELLSMMKEGRNLYLLSDCGMPAISDPGVSLVNRCHLEGIRVTSLPFNSSFTLALALSGYKSDQFLYAGIVPLGEDRIDALKNLVREKRTIILFDTPYRLKKLLDDMLPIFRNREICLAMDLCSVNEFVARGSIEKLVKKITEWKREFVIVVSPLEK